MREMCEAVSDTCNCSGKSTFNSGLRLETRQTFDSSDQADSYINGKFQIGTLAELQTCDELSAGLSKVCPSFHHSWLPAQSFGRAPIAQIQKLRL